MSETNLTRRQAVGAAGATASYLLLTRTPVSSLFTGDAKAAASCASLSPSKTIGPYFVEEKLDRSDITTDPSNGTTVAGVPLTLELTLMDEDNGCQPLSGATVDIWHASPGGKYSDESVEGTSGQKYLRGYQVSDSNGKATFKTVYPGWYTGRTVHIHIRIRLGSYDFTTQLFFDDSLTDTVYTVAPYSSRGARDTRNSQDGIYGSDGATLIPAMSGDNSSGYTGTFTFGLSKVGAGSTGGSTTTGTTTSSADKSVGCRIVSAKISRARILHVTVKNTEAVVVQLKFRRGTKTLAKKSAVYKTSGTHVIKLALPSSAVAGRGTLTLAIADSAQNSKVLTRHVHIPKRI